MRRIVVVLLVLLAVTPVFAGAVALEAAGEKCEF